jgi:type I restriction enzyme M protein
MSEELIQKGYVEHGLIIGNYQFYNIGNSTLNQLKKAKIVPNKDYGKYARRRPDGLIVDRSDISNVKVISVIEYKDHREFQSANEQIFAIEECNDLCQVLDAKVGIATDNSSFVWFNPNQKDVGKEYSDRTTGTKRYYTIIKDEKNFDYIEEFLIDQKIDEINLEKLKPKTLSALKNLNFIIQNTSPKNSKLISPLTVDATKLAKQIWQDIWSVSGATPEKCLYTFVELFIFKYLSDLEILTTDGSGNKVNFKDIFAIDQTKSFKNYSQNVRPHLKKMFPASKDDFTTIINGSVLNPDVPEHSQTFHKILKKFDVFGELKNIDPNFKSRVFEEFMKQSISKKNWGQYFTPRNIIEAVLRISDIEKLEKNSKICDPACGVGGFILEPIKTIPNGVNFYYQISGNNIIPKHHMVGFDKGFEKEEQLTIILAKANMLIFLSELLTKNPNMSTKFAELFNSTFKLNSKTILGTLSQTDHDQYDLILTNPPYVTSGSSNYKNAIKENSDLEKFYKINALGVESLFLEWIVNSLKPSKKAFVIIPDGILNRHDNKLREFIKKECIIDGIISLPVNAFYTTPKKTYILAITKKPFDSSTERQKTPQIENVFTYLASSVGETLDAKRFPIPENDLGEMVSLFNQFKGAKDSFVTDKKRCKIQPIEKFNLQNHWAVDRWWTKEEKIDLGIEEESSVVSLDEFLEKTNDLGVTVQDLSDELNKIKDNELKTIKKIDDVSSDFKRVQLSDEALFTLGIGKRVLKVDLFRSKEKIPVYSANVFTPMGYQKKSNISKFENDYVLWGIDGTFEFNIKHKGEIFASTDHCGTIEILDSNIVPEYLVHQLEIGKHKFGFDRGLRSSLANMRLEVSVKIPVKKNGGFDKKSQLKMMDMYNILKKAKQDLENQITELNKCVIE